MRTRTSIKNWMKAHEEGREKEEEGENQINSKQRAFSLAEEQITRFE